MRRPIKRIFFLILVLMPAGCIPQKEERSIEEKEIHVKTRVVGREQYKIPVVTTGLLSTAKEMKLSFKTGGIIKEIKVREGQSCKKGDVLASLDLSEISAQVSQARIARDKANRDLNRARNLYQDSVVTLEQYQNAGTAFEIAKNQKDIADFNLRHSMIKAPTDGKIMKILGESNEMTGAGYPVILFASTENDWVVRASLTDKDIVRLSIGDSATVFMDAFPRTVFPGEVSELATVADPVSGTYEVEILVFKELPQFKTGFICRVEILPAKTHSSLVVPIESLTGADDHAAFVFIYKDGTARKTRVKTGRILGSRVVILEGLEEGMRLITEGADYLKGGERVLEEQMP